MENVNVWKANFTNGLILGLIGVVYTLVLYFLDLYSNQPLGYLFLVIQIFILIYLIKMYRDNYLHGMMTFGKGLGAGMVICVYSAIISAIFAYILFKFIDTGLIDKQMALAEEKLLERGMSQSQIDAAMVIQKKIMIPEVMAPISLVSSIFLGLITSLIAAAFTRKEGNPLIDNTQQ